MSGHLQNVKVCSSCAEPLHVEVCNNPTDFSFSETVWCVGGQTLIRQSSWLDAAQTVTWLTVAGAAVVPSPAQLAAATAGSCSGALAPDNEFLVLCDTATNPPTPYIRRAIVNPITAVATWSNVNVLTGAAYVPTTPGTCDGYTLTVDETCVLDAATGVITSARITQVWRYGTAIGVPVISNSATGAIIPIAGALQHYDCSAIDVALIPFCRTDNGLVVLRKIVSVAGSEVFSEWIDLATNATIAAPAAGILTQDCDVQVDFETACALIGGVQVAVEIRRTFRDGTLTSTAYVRLDTNVPIATPTIVPCQQISGSFTALRCGATSNTTTNAAVTGTRVVLANDVILTKACPTTSGLTNSTVAAAVNAVVSGTAGVPTNARGVTVYNSTRARINFTISSHGTVVIPPGATWSGNLPDNVPPYSGTWTVSTAAGNSGPAVFGINPNVAIDWVTRV